MYLKSEWSHKLANFILKTTLQPAVCQVRQEAVTFFP